MKIDNRLFIPLAMPFVILGMMRLLFLLAGAEWSEPEFAAAFSLFTGGFIGVLVVVGLFINDIHLGHTTIGRKE